MMSGASLSAMIGQPGSADAQEAVKWSRGTELPKTTIPPDSIDCHHHIYDSKYPAAPSAVSHPGDATVADYRRLRKRIGTSRNVVIQPSTYGVDNSLLLDSLNEFGVAARGVAVVNTDVSDAELKRLNDGRVRGIRFNFQTAGAGTTFAMVEPLAKRIAPMGWHIQFNAYPDQIVENAALIGSLPCPVVFDHIAPLCEPRGVTHPAFAFLVGLMKKDKAWVKLSGAYADSKIGAPTYADRTVIAQAFVREAPDHLVWGSDWPHPTEKDNDKPDDALLLDLLAQWAPDVVTRNRILVDNPTRLYNFGVA
jgi:predicted TIM-barrel fold metal-dependent hydrolase